MNLEIELTSKGATPTNIWEKARWGVGVVVSENVSENEVFNEILD